MLCALYGCCIIQVSKTKLHTLLFSSGDNKLTRIRRFLQFTQKLSSSLIIQSWPHFVWRRRRLSGQCFSIQVKFNHCNFTQSPSAPCYGLKVSRLFGADFELCLTILSKLIQNPLLFFLRSERYNIQSTSGDRSGESQIPLMLGLYRWSHPSYYLQKVIQ